MIKGVQSTDSVFAIYMTTTVLWAQLNADFPFLSSADWAVTGGSSRVRAPGLNVLFDAPRAADVSYWLTEGGGLGGVALPFVASNAFQQPQLQPEPAPPLDRTVRVLPQAVSIQAAAAAAWPASAGSSLGSTPRSRPLSPHALSDDALSGDPGCALPKVRRLGGEGGGVTFIFELSSLSLLPLSGCCFGCWAAEFGVPLPFTSRDWTLSHHKRHQHDFGSLEFSRHRVRGCWRRPDQDDGTGAAGWDALWVQGEVRVVCVSRRAPTVCARS